MPYFSRLALFRESPLKKVTFFTPDGRFANKLWWSQHGRKLELFGLAENDVTKKKTFTSTGFGPSSRAALPEDDGFSMSSAPHLAHISAFTHIIRASVRVHNLFTGTRKSAPEPAFRIHTEPEGWRNFRSPITDTGKLNPAGLTSSFHLHMPACNRTPVNLSPRSWFAPSALSRQRFLFDKLPLRSR